MSWEPRRARAEHLIPLAPGWSVELDGKTQLPMLGWIANDDGVWPAAWVKGVGLMYFDGSSDARVTDIRPT